MEIGVVLDCPPQFDREAEYVFHTLLGSIGVSYTVYPADTPARRVERPACDMIFCYGREGDPRRRGDGFLVNILCENFGEVWSDTDSQIKLSRVSGARRMPSGHVLFVGCASPQPGSRAMVIDASDEKPLVTLSEQISRIDILFDLIASTFYLLSGEAGRCIETLGAGEQPLLDGHELSLSGVLEEPIVNNYMEIFLNLLILAAEKRETALLQKWYWPRSNDFALFLAHDVEMVPRRSLRREVARVAKEMLQLEPKKAIAHMSRTLRYNRMRREPFGSFSELVRLETEHSLSSSFYFPGVGGGSRQRDVDEEKISGALRELKRSGFEVGLRVDEGSSPSGPEIRAEKQLLESALESEITGLHQCMPGPHAGDSYLLQEEAAFVYDSPVGLDSRAGYRAGFAFPYFPYIRSERRASCVLEIPVVIADRELFRKEPDARVALWRVSRIIRRTSRYHGLLGMLWRTYSREVNGPVDHFGVYRELLKRFDGRWVFNDTGASLAKWWLERKAVRISRFTRSESSLEWTLNAANGIKHLTLKLYPGFPDYEVEVIGATFFMSRAGHAVTLQLQKIEPEEEVTISLIRK